MYSEGRVDDRDYSIRKLQTSLSVERDAIQLLDLYSIFFENINLLHINVRKKLLEQNP